MIYYDVTKMRDPRQKSGLARVSGRLRQELADQASLVVWKNGEFIAATDRAERIVFQPDDWLLTVELFGEEERPGFAAWLARRECRRAAVFHDAIPVRWPHITWPQSVRRHPGYMKMLAEFECVLAVSEASRRDLEGFWRWQDAKPQGRTGVIALGADFDGSAWVNPGVESRPGGDRARPSVLCVGILEPRKNQVLLLEVCEGLWAAGLDFDLHFVGRVNPHFGKPVEKKIRRAAKKEHRLYFHEAASDAILARLYATTQVAAFPTLAEGCGLPVLEALWHGVPCLCSDLPALRENADDGGCVIARVNDTGDWSAQLRLLLTNPVLRNQLAEAARLRELPRWSDTARALRVALV
jgi:glycosyltransferase involved in cell wall biosynthesis